MNGDPEGIILSKGLHPDDVDLVRAHEIRHVIESIAGKRVPSPDGYLWGAIPHAGLTDELKPVYNDLNNGNRARDGSGAASWVKPETPLSMGYSRAEQPREWMAEAIPSQHHQSSRSPPMRVREASVSVWEHAAGLFRRTCDRAARDPAWRDLWPSVGS